MAHSLSARKRARQSVKRHTRTQIVKSKIKTQLKKTRSMLVIHKDAPDKNVKKETLAAELTRTTKLIDKAVSKGIIHKNKAARLKSRLNLAANKLPK